ncbi:proteasome assembly chaperone 2 [Protopterus annectens]|uniref:proteasome assembly chaperone 2 n=1 Tax=Protopterus annectens TaxID=7888 RepID=UPI001CFACD82|nr:proteasome assembly chaperone 2 [Protopterus annectens]
MSKESHIFLIMFIASDSKDLDFRGFSLILPAVSVGNVGQLAVDLLISTLTLPRVGYIYTECLVPMAGSNPYARSADDAVELSINAEVYSLPEKKLAVLQIRSPVLQNKSKEFRQIILSWVKQNGFSKVVLLSSSHAYQRDDRQLLGTPLRYLMTPDLQSIVQEKLQSLSWKELERIAAFPGVSETEQQIYIPGGGFTKSLFQDSCSEGIPMAILLIFCSEGDNIPDAFALVNYLNDWLQLVECTGSTSSMSSVQWIAPSSWKLLFGCGLPPLIF